MEGLPDTWEERPSAADHLTDRHKGILSARRRPGQRVDNRRHAGKDRYPILAGQADIFLKIKALHHHPGRPGFQGRKTPGDADMRHRIDAKVGIVLRQAQKFPFGVHRCHPVAVGEHRAFLLPGRPRRVLKLTDIIIAAVMRPECR